MFFYQPSSAFDVHVLRTCGSTTIAVLPSVRPDNWNVLTLLQTVELLLLPLLQSPALLLLRLLGIVNDGHIGNCGCRKVILSGETGLLPIVWNLRSSGVPLTIYWAVVDYLLKLKLTSRHLINFLWIK
jgi:hypothetical protein